MQNFPQKKTRAQRLGSVEASTWGSGLQKRFQGSSHIGVYTLHMDDQPEGMKFFSPEDNFIVFVFYTISTKREEMKN
jgi:hypothetical protein